MCELLTIVVSFQINLGNVFMCTELKNGKLMHLPEQELHYQSQTFTDALVNKFEMAR